MRGADQATLEFYSRESDRFREPPGDRDWVAKYMRPFAAALPGRRVLELGCGAGRDAAALIEFGLDVEATDGCAEVARVAEQRLSKPVRVMRFDELDASERYDGIWASATLLHVPRPDLVDVLSRVWRALVPRGMLYASFKTGKPEGRDKFGRYFNYPTEDELREFLVRAGKWKSIEFDMNSGYGSDQVMTDWLHCLAQKDATPSSPA